MRRQNHETPQQRRAVMMMLILFISGWTNTASDVTPVILSRNFIARQSYSVQLRMLHTATNRINEPNKRGFLRLRNQFILLNKLRV